MSNGIKMVVTHASFEAGLKSREDFVHLLLDGWNDVKIGQGINITPVCSVSEEEPEVSLFFTYGEHDLDVRSAELAAAASMATLSLTVMHLNQSGDKKAVFAAYSFAIERDVPMPEVSGNGQASKRVAARSSN